MKKSVRININFRHLTCNAGKGQKNGLRRLEIKEGDRVVTVCNKNEIEWIIINHNKEHFRKAKGNKVCNYKIFYTMKEDETRHDILNGEFRRDECDNDDVHQFLFLLKIQNWLTPDNEEDMQEIEWKQIVRKVKKRSTSSAFLMRDYSVHECALESDRVVTFWLNFTT